MEDLRRAAKAAAFVEADRVAMVSRTAETIDSGKVLSTNIRGLPRRLAGSLG